MNRIISRIHKSGQTKVVIGARNRQTAISNNHVLSFFMKGSYSFRRFNCNMEFIPDCCIKKPHNILFHLEMTDVFVT